MTGETKGFFPYYVIVYLLLYAVTFAYILILKSGIEIKENIQRLKRDVNRECIVSYNS